MTERQAWAALAEMFYTPAGLCAAVNRLQMRGQIGPKIATRVRRRIRAEVRAHACHANGTPAPWPDGAFAWPVSREGNYKRMLFCGEQVERLKKAERRRRKKR